MSYSKSEDTRGKLLSTMSHLLRIQGYNATGIQQIIKESGIPKGSLYYHFPEGKTELAALSVKKSADKLSSVLRKITSSSKQPEVAVQLLCDFFIAEMSKQKFTRGCPLATITLETAATVDRIQEECRDGFEQLISIFRNLLTESGLMENRASDLATLALSAIEGALILCKAQRSTAPLAVVRDNMVSQIKEALAAND